MSCVYKGEVIQSELSKTAKGGTEMMRDRLLGYVNPDYLERCAIHFSRPRKVYNDVPNILYCHDLANDPENSMLEQGGWMQFVHIVFVTCWQRDQYITKFGIPHSRCSVIYNAVEKEPVVKDYTDIGTIKFVYHTTPHRGLELLVPIFEELCQIHDNITLDVYSSFSIYGWDKRDERYQDCFDRIQSHPSMTYHGAVSNEEVLKALDDSHVFLYPNIWTETSCIALIEAMKSQVICVHPDLGALPETAASGTIMYPYTENIQSHANMAYSVADFLIENIRRDSEFFPKTVNTERYVNPKNSVQSFGSMWNATLANILDN
jgi:glycosyltransferase involved in cell wall biosynthesis